MPHVVLVGGGHAHLHTLRQATALIRAGADVTLIAPHHYHYYSGMGPGLLGGTYREQETRVAVASLIRSRGGRFVQGRVRLVDPERRTLTLDNGDTVSYDLVSFNTGSYVPAERLGASNGQVIPVKPVENLARVRRLILERHGAPPTRLLVVGGGPAGVEVAANLAKLGRDHALPLQITLFDQGNRILARMPPRAAQIARRVLSSQGIEIIPRQRLVTLGAGNALSETGESFPFDYAFLTIGIEPDRLFGDSGLPTSADGGMLVDGHLQAVDHPEIFGGGDCASFASDSLPRVGVYAVRQAPVLFHNLLASVHGGPLAKFVPQRSYLLILNLGDGTGLVVWGRWAWRGRLGFRWKNYLDCSFMERFQRCGEMREDPGGAPGHTDSPAPPGRHRGQLRTSKENPWVG